MNEVTTIEQTQPVAVDPIVSLIERVVSDPSADISKLEAMLKMKEQLDATRAKEAFAAAFAQASANFPNIPLNGVGHNKKPYATLKDIIAHTRPVLSEHGLALTFSIETGEKILVTAELMHKAGHTKSTTIALPSDSSGSKNAVQAIGSSQTYGQRYTAQAVLGLSLGEDTEDDARGTNTSTVSPEQYVKLRDKLEESGFPEAKLFAAFGHKDPASASLTEFPAKDFQEAMNSLAKFMEKKTNG